MRVPFYRCRSSWHCPRRSRPPPVPHVLSCPTTAARAYADIAPSRPQLWQPQRPETQLVERPIADLIAARLGLVKGSAELFRYHLVNAPTNNAMLRGADRRRRHQAEADLVGRFSLSSVWRM